KTLSARATRSSNDGATTDVGAAGRTAATSRASASSARPGFMATYLIGTTRARILPRSAGRFARQIAAAHEGGPPALAEKADECWTISRTWRIRARLPAAAA